MPWQIQGKNPCHKGFIGIEGKILPQQLQQQGGDIRTKSKAVWKQGPWTVAMSMNVVS